MSDKNPFNDGDVTRWLEPDERWLYRFCRTELVSGVSGPNVSVQDLLRTVAQLRQLVEKKDKALRRSIKVLTVAANHISPEYRGKGQVYDDALADIQPVLTLGEKKTFEEGNGRSITEMQIEVKINTYAVEVYKTPDASPEQLLYPVRVEVDNRAGDTLLLDFSDQELLYSFLDMVRQKIMRIDELQREEFSEL